MSQEYERNVEVVKLNADTEKGLLEQFGIQSIPTMVYYKSDGKFVVKPVTVSKQFLEELFIEVLAS